jgi:hypothetical protein
MKRNKPRLNARHIRAIAAISVHYRNGALFRQFNGVDKQTAAKLESVAAHHINQTGIARMRAALRG